MNLIRWNLISVRLDTMLVSMQDRCIVCARRTIGSEIIVDTPNGTTSNEAQVEAHFGSFRDSAKIDA